MIPSIPLTARQRLWRQAVRWILGKPRATVYSQDIINSPLPIDVGAEIINTCNADCSFCGYGKGPKGKAADPRPKRKLDRSIYSHILKLYSDAGGGSFALSPILGEITAHPDWIDMVREARSHANIVGVSCFTNAILFDRFDTKEVLTSGLTHMAISTSLGSREQYKRLYGVDKYDQVVSNILNLLRMNATLGRPILFSLLLRIDKPFDVFLSSDLYKEITTYIDPGNIEILDNLWDDFHGVIGQDGIPVGHEFKYNAVDKTVPCYALFRKLQVLIDGTIQGCSCRVEPELWAGNIKDYQSLGSAWRDPALQRLRDNWAAGNIPDCCKKCSHYQPFTNLIEDTSPARLARSLARRLLRRRPREAVMSDS
ncbi:MAG: SPASM domain-containing protein [Ferrovibrio sp.]|uniref:radical SAM/SPASM domain-containing protein n=1 Tax=Ferrovibrio sp. TaxID=1917215 RepID=UPI0026289697|nr:radical SAM protein [Ferrovibrio sp.]MCW0234926.1 SPASM domain-containing protein [Ferrovibrio sp.]